MSSPSPRVTVQVVDSDDDNNSSQIVEHMTYEIIREAKCAFPDLYNADNRHSDDSVLMLYEDFALSILSVLITVFLLTFIVLDIRYRYRRYLFKLKRDRLKFTTNRSYKPFIPRNLYYDYKDGDYEEIEEMIY